MFRETFPFEFKVFKKWLCSEDTVMPFSERRRWRRSGYGKEVGGGRRKLEREGDVGSM